MKTSFVIDPRKKLKFVNMLAALIHHILLFYLLLNSQLRESNRLNLSVIPD